MSEISHDIRTDIYPNLFPFPYTQKSAGVKVTYRNLNFIPNIIERESFKQKSLGYRDSLVKYSQVIDIRVLNGNIVKTLDQNPQHNGRKTSKKHG